MVKFSDISLKITGLICCGDRSQQYEFERCVRFLSYGTKGEQYLTVILQAVRMCLTCYMELHLRHI